MELVAYRLCCLCSGVLAIRGGREAPAPRSGTELAPPHLGRWSPSLWTVREIPEVLCVTWLWILMVERVSPVSDGETGPTYGPGWGVPLEWRFSWILAHSTFLTSPLCSKPQAEFTNEEMWETSRVIPLHEHRLLFILPSQNPLII